MVEWLILAVVACQLIGMIAGAWYWWASAKNRGW